MITLGSVPVAHQLPIDGSSLGWRLATQGLKASGCQARRSLHAWQRAGCQAVANRGPQLSRSSGYDEQRATDSECAGHVCGVPRRSSCGPHRPVGCEIPWRLQGRVDVRRLAIVVLRGQKSRTDRRDSTGDVVGDRQTHRRSVRHCTRNAHETVHAPILLGSACDTMTEWWHPGWRNDETP